MTHTPPLPDLLPCDGGGEWPVQYFMTFECQEFYIRYKRGELSVTLEGTDERELLHQRIGEVTDSDWSDEETTVYLTLISEAIRAGRLEELDLPSISEAPAHEYYIKGFFPQHCVGLICGRTQAPVPHDLKMNRHDRRRRREAGLHDHDDSCYVSVPAKDVERWVSGHPLEHQDLLREQTSGHEV